MDSSSHLIRLIRIYAGLESTLDAPLSDLQWNAVCQQAWNQYLDGVLYKAIQLLSSGMKPSVESKMSIAWYGEEMAERNMKMNARCVCISEEIRKMGFDCCVLKGQGLEMLYPYRNTRTCGDIDLWIQGGTDEILRAIGSRWKVHDVCYHHAGIRPFKGSTEVEIHFRPSWMNNPFTNRRLQNYFKYVAGQQFGNFRKESVFPVPDMEFNCVMETVHICRHLLFEGVGMRQIIDMYYILLHSTPQERKNASRVLSSLRISRFTGALMYVLCKWFDLGQEYFLAPADESYGIFLEKEILLAGNFGQSDGRYAFDRSSPLFRRVAMRMNRLVHYFTIAPSEVIWAPVFKAWQYIWMRRYRTKEIK